MPLPRGFLNSTSFLSYAKKVNQLRPAVKGDDEFYKISTLFIDRDGTIPYIEAMKRIHLYAIDIGGGHIAPAMAIKQEIDRMGRKDIEVRVVNLGKALRAHLLSAVYKTYWKLALKYPPLINAFYSGADNPFSTKITDGFFGITLLPRLHEYLRREKPDVVVSTYFTFTHYLEALQRVDQLDAVAVALNPEPFDSHSVWFSPLFPWTMVFSEKSRREIVKKGIPADTVKVFQFPIKPSAARRTVGSGEVRRELGLDPSRFTLLICFGAEGVGPVRSYLREIAAAGIPIQVVVVCGRNVLLRNRLEKDAAAHHGDPLVVIKGFVPDLPDYVAAADLVLGKSGPNQVFETLMQERPIVIASQLDNEKETGDWVVENRLGWVSRSPRHFLSLLRRILRDPRILEEYRGHIRRMAVRSGTPEIAEFLVGIADRKD